MEDIKKYLQYDEKEKYLFMPNEIFEDLGLLREKGSSHIAFAYSYYYLTCWLYRYAKYGLLDIDVKVIKQLLGYNSNYQGLDYIIKKNGTLDSLAYTDTRKDYPLSWVYEDDLEFYMLSEVEEDLQSTIKRARSRKYTIKYPQKAFFRTKDSEDDEYLDGTFYEFDDTHLVPFEVFIFCMSNEKIGCAGFYLWCYLKMKNQIYINGYDVNLETLSKATGIAKSTMINYLNVLRQYMMINCLYNQEFFCLKLKEEDRKANTYINNEHTDFLITPVEFEKLKTIKIKEYKKLLQDENKGVIQLYG